MGGGPLLLGSWKLVLYSNKKGVGGWPGGSGWLESQARGGVLLEGPARHHPGRLCERCGQQGN